MSKRKSENRGVRRKNPRSAGQSGKPGRRGHDRDKSVWLFGTHAVHAALKNPARSTLSLYATQNAAKELPPDIAGVKIVAAAEIDSVLPPGAVHQGLALLTEPLPPVAIEELEPIAREDTIVVLDQITDPQNIGAILRSCAAFGVRALIMQERHSPPLGGTVAKAATGALEHVAISQVTNISRALEQLAEMGYERIGLAEEGDLSLPDYRRDGPVALVFGAEGPGLRRLTREHCDRLISLPTSSLQSSLNVSNAAAVTLYAVRPVRQP